MKEKLTKLINVKTIITVILTSVFAYLSVKGRISGDQFLVVFTTVIAFYFGTQHEKTKTE